ncbi:MAG: MlaE family lipid ABC transporter permease subunit [Alphaproteobacteria bacterium]|nr:MlaE family lipid ABC transporter permease subunit [Alphaproteobacteria bacterium]
MAREGEAGAWLEAVQDATTLVIKARGDWIVRHADAADKAIAHLDAQGRSSVIFDLSNIGKLDTTGAWLLHKAQRFFQNQGATSTFIGVNGPQATLLDAVTKADKPMEHPPHGNPVLVIVERMGRTLEDVGHTMRDATAFFGLVLETLGKTILNPRRMRLTSTVYHMEQAGLDAVPIVSLISFLIGAVLAFQGAEQLRKFGGEVFTVNLVAISFLREVGILLTAIMVAGRSGSAFTAQIGSMKVREEVDAMRTLGLDPAEVLVLPRVIALIVMMPILGFIAAIMGLSGGGLVVLLQLGMSPEMYIQRLYDALDFWDVFTGVIKAPVFGLLIAVIGCFEGMKVEGSAESVGQRTTASVVEGIFTVIVIDAFFSILFIQLGL